MSADTANAPTAFKEHSPTKSPQSLTSDALVERARKISSHIEACAAEAERNRNVPDHIVEMIEAAGIYEMLVPKRFGGHEMTIGDMVRVIKALSPLDASMGWTTSFYIGHNWMWCLLPEAAQREIFADGPSARGPVMVAPTVKAKTVENGFVINGRAKWGTGSAHAQWCMVGGLVESSENAAPDVRMFAMPWKDARVEDTWYTSGMAATASNDVIFENVFVPEHRVMSVADARNGEAPGAKVHDNPLYTAPFSPFLCLIAVMPLVAVARGISQHATQRAKDFVSTFSGQKNVDNPTLQVRLAKVDLMTQAAETLLDELASTLDWHTHHARPSMDERVLMRAKASYIAALCRDAVTMLAQGSGASAHMSDSPIQRAMRDLNMASCHVVFDQDPTMELHGKMLVGSAPPVIMA